MSRIKCPHCGKEVTTKWSTFSMLMPVSFSVGLHKLGAREGVSVSSLVNKAILNVKKSDSLPLCPPSNQSVGYNLSTEALDKAKKIADDMGIGVRLVVRSAVALAYFNK